MSEILSKLELKLSHVQRGELITNIILGIWQVMMCVCFIADIMKIHAVMIVLIVLVFPIIIVDGYFILAIFYYKHKIKKYKQE